mmetsp:Transcript_56856/g.144140  ORF Transcript_56856/g.144140 Transcript_56856/m.144140 type:complete len:258 (+) Transcript_56856:56-829(+)|eukprot:CAMPEP_0115242900 /NCGR_PEP_ID=MMETSP0270-20121206/39193_1 /TAXON_ID=71861 /ORGANISM="Scrippsiella trochoidea, Strain CCMP3099" /LENGTH=257 /DNA_ID=CAMNT_0002657985 /DNA_START=52 /DNA_END=825 /DNA_ORIENTATION=+
MARLKVETAAAVDAAKASTKADTHRPPLAKQSQGALASGLTIALVLWAFFQEVMQPAAMRMTWMSVPYIIVTSYLYCDYWLWMLHCFLDRKENLKSRISLIAYMAKQFQDHHDVPATLLEQNHFGEIDDLVAMVSGMGLALGAWTSPATKLIVAGVTMWGGLGGLNHFYCHALTHGYEVPPLYKYGQLWGLLPTARHHKTHHTAPFESNWNFLNGLYRIYEGVYFATGSSYNALFGMFYSCNPVVIQVWALGLGALA